MKTALRLIGAVIAFIGLTILVFLGLTRVNPLLAWLHSDSGYNALAPLFHAYGAAGVEGHEEVIGLVLIAASAAISAIVVFAMSRIISRRIGH